jgi:hypothetical protein
MVSGTAEKHVHYFASILFLNQWAELFLFQIRFKMDLLNNTSQFVVITARFSLILFWISLANVTVFSFNCCYLDIFHHCFILSFTFWICI